MRATLRERPILTGGYPQWRYDRIMGMIANREPMPRSEADPWLRRGYQYFWRWERDDCPNRSRRLLSTYPDIYNAHALFEDERSEKWLAEAATLSDTSLEQVSEYIGQPVSVLAAYEKLFYDIRPNLKARGYILNRIIIPSVQHGLDGRDYDFMMKMISFNYGWEAAKMFFGSGVMTDETRKMTRQAMADDLLKKGWTAVHRVELNGFSSPKMIEACLKLREIEANSGPAAAQDEVVKTFGMLLESCATTILPIAELPAPDEPRVKELMGGAKPDPYLKPVNGTVTS